MSAADRAALEHTANVSAAIARYRELSALKLPLDSGRRTMVEGVRK